MKSEDFSFKTFSLLCLNYLRCSWQGRYFMSIIALPSFTLFRPHVLEANSSLCRSDVIIQGILFSCRFNLWPTITHTLALRGIQSENSQWSVGLVTGSFVTTRLYQVYFTEMTVVFRVVNKYYSLRFNFAHRICTRFWQRCSHATKQQYPLRPPRCFNIAILYIVCPPFLAY